MTLRDLYNLTAAARGHWVVCGTPKRIADTLEEWFVEERRTASWSRRHFPGAFADFVDSSCRSCSPAVCSARTTPGRTLRDHLGVPAPGRSTEHGNQRRSIPASLGHDLDLLWDI